MELMDVLSFGNAVMIEGEDDINPMAGLLSTAMPSSLAAAVVTLKHVPSVALHMMCAIDAAIMKSKFSNFTISLELVATVILYTQEDPNQSGHKFYQQLNIALRSRFWDNARPYFGFLRMLVEALRHLPSHRGIVYRGIAGVDLTKKFPIGKHVRVWEVQSVSKQRRISESFASSGNRPEQTLLIIETHGVAALGPLALYVGEEECLFLPGTAFVATKAEYVGSRAVIYLKHRAEDVTMLYK
jgi:hypothetical protein